MRLLVGVSRSADSPLCPLVDAVTHARLAQPWVLSSGPATHALTVVDPAMGGSPAATWWRLDAVGPRPSNPLGRATWRPWTPVLASEVALWHVDTPEAPAGIAVARGQTGRCYDLLALAGQLHLMLARLPGLPAAGICTDLVVEQLAACGAGPRAAVDLLADLLPERLAQALSRQAWAVRVV